MARRWRYPRSRRGFFYRFTPAVVVSSPPPYVPVFQEPSGRGSRYAGMRSRRGRFLTTPSALPLAHRPRRGVIRLTSVRRGKFFTVPFVVAATTAPWIPAATDIRRAPSRTVRRGRYFTVPLVGDAPPPPITIPQVTRERVRLWAIRRGHYWNAPQVPQAPVVPSWVPVFTRARRPLTGSTRRGDYQAVPQATPCPYRVASRRTRLPAYRRSRLWEPPRITQTAGPGPLVARTKTRRAPCLPTRRGVFIEPFWIGLAPNPVVIPDTVTVTPREYASTASGRDIGDSATARSNDSTATPRSPA